MKKTLMVAVIGALVAGGATLAFAQADVIKERQENRKQVAAGSRREIRDRYQDHQGPME